MLHGFWADASGNPIILMGLFPSLASGITDGATLVRWAWPALVTAANNMTATDIGNASLDFECFRIFILFLRRVYFYGARASPYDSFSARSF